MKTQTRLVMYCSLSWHFVNLNTGVSKFKLWCTTYVQTSAQHTIRDHESLQGANWDTGSYCVGQRVDAENTAQWLSRNNWTKLHKAMRIVCWKNLTHPTWRRWFLIRLLKPRKVSGRIHEISYNWTHFFKCLQCYVFVFMVVYRDLLKWGRPWTASVMFHTVIRQ